MATMKIKKDETIRFDGTWITNGFWMSHRNRITLSDVTPILSYNLRKSTA